MNHIETRNSISGVPNEFVRPQTLQPSFHSTGVSSLARLLARRWRWIVGSVLICVCLAMVISHLTRPVYQATSTIELNKNGGAGIESALGDVLFQQLGSDSDSLQTDLQTETAILQGDSLALAVIEKLNLASTSAFSAQAGPDPERGLRLEDAPRTRTRLLGAFKGGLKVAPLRGTRLIRVTYESHDPKQAALIANALIDGYKSQYLRSHYEATSEASDWLAKQLSDLKANVEDSEKKLTDFEKETGILSLDLTSGSGSSGEGQIHSVTIQKLDQLNTELTTAEINRIEKEAIYRLSESNNGDVVLGLASDPLALQSNSMVLTQGGGLSTLQQLKQQENDVKMRIASASTTYGANNRHLKELETELQTLGQQIQQEMREIVHRAGADFQLAKETEEQIRRQFDKQQEEASRLNEKTVQFAVLSQEANSSKKLYEDLYTKLQEANVSAGLKATNITVVDPARVQSIPVRPKMTTNLALGILFGIFLGLGTAYTVDTLDRAVHNPLEVEEITGRPVIGAIPSFDEVRSPYGFGLASIPLRTKPKKLVAQQSVRAPMSIWMLDHPDSAASEAFRILRTSIMLARPGGELKTILITGSMSGEGKTTVAANLGVAFAQYNKRVIVVESDMRRPKLKHKYDLAAKVGLSSVLAGACCADDAVLQAPFLPSLDILPAGPRPPMPSELLGSHAFDELLQHLRSRYDIILLDSPPALIVTDPVAMSFKVEAVIWVAQAGVVTRPQLVRALHMIDRNSMPVIGFVVNRISRKTSGYGYGYEYKTYGAEYGDDRTNEK